MLDKKILILLILISLVTVSAASASENVETIDNLGEVESLALNSEILSSYESEAVISEVNEGNNASFDYLNGLISAQENTNLTLTNDFKYNENYDTEYENGILIDKDNFILDGNNHVIDADNKSRIFNVEANNVTLKNIKFINAFASHASAIYASGKSMTIINCTFDNNYAENEAGAIYINATDARLYNSTFTNNCAKTGGAVYGQNASVYISNSNFEKNIAKSSAGGGVRLNEGKATIEGTVFKSNFGDYAGALYINNLNDGAIINCIFTNNSAQTTGGTLESRKSNKLLLDNTTFIENRALTNNGGAAYLHGENTNILNSRFIGNAAEIHGGAVYSTSSDKGMISNCLFENNTAGSFFEGQGGALNWNGQQVLITYSNFTSNKANDSGAVDILSKNGNIAYCIFTNNEATTGGAGAINIQEANITLSDCNFTNNSASTSAGSIYWLSYAVNGTVINCRFINSSSKWGGAIRWQSAHNGKIINSTFINCTGNEQSSAMGGAIYYRTANNGQIDGCVFINCSSGNGGSIFNTGKNLTISNCNFTDSHSIEGGLAIHTTGDEVTISKCNFAKTNANMTYSNFTGVIDWNSNGNILDCTINQTNATYAVLIDGYYNFDGMLHLNNNNFDKPIYMTDGNILSPTSIQILENATYTAYEDDIITLQADVRDDNDNIIVTRQPLTFVLSNGTELSASLNGNIWQYAEQFNIPDNYTVSAKLKGLEDISVNTSEIIVIKVFDFPENITAGEDVNATVSLPNSTFTGEGILIYDGKTSKIKLENGTANFTIENITGGKHSINIVTIDENNETKITSKIFNVDKLPNDLKVKITRNATVGGDVILYISNPNLAGETITLISDIGPTQNVTLNQRGYFYAYIRNATVGNHYATIISAGNDYYKATTVTVPFTVEKETPEINVTISEITSDGANVTVSIPGATGNVSVIVDGVENVVTLDENGTATYTIPEVTGGEHSIVVIYDGDDSHNGAHASKTLYNEEFPTKFTNITIADGKLTGILSLPSGEGLSDETVSVSVNGVTTNVTTDSNGSFTIEDIMGKVIELNYAGNGTILPCELTIDLTGTEVEPKDPELNASAENNTLTVNINKEATGYVLVDAGGQGYYAPVKDGQATINIIGLDEGTYEATVTYLGDKAFKAANTTVSVTVPKKEDPAPVDPKADIEITNTTVSITVPEDATGYLLVDVDGQGYYTPIKDGQATINLPELEAGNHTVTATYTGDNKYAQANKTENITVEDEIETIIAEDLIKVEKAPDRFEATFTDADGKALTNTDVTFTINGVTYTRTTDSNGKASIGINIEAGNYTITIKNPVTNETKDQKITVLSRFAEHGDLIKYFRNASQYIVKILDDDGNPAKAGEVVTFNINGVFYNRTANATGHVRLNINLNPGDYIITAEYKGCKVSDNIRVLPTLTGKDITKKYGESDAYEATLVDGQGKPYAKQKIEFNINGVIYMRTTDSEGVAQLNINLQPGQYIITASYENARISNTVTVTA